MSLFESLEILSKRQGKSFGSCELFDLNNFLSNHSVSVGIRGHVLPTKISLFSQIKLSNVITLKLDELIFTEIEINKRRLKVQNV